MRLLHPMPLAARRSYRLASATTLALTGAYALALPLPYLAPVLALVLTAPGAPPPGLRNLLALILLVLLTLGVGLLTTPLLVHHTGAALLISVVGIHLAMVLSVHRQKGLPGMLVALGFTMIPAAGTVSPALAAAVIDALVVGIVVAVVAQWIVYPWFPEDAAAPPIAAPGDASAAPWIALRATAIVFPPFLVALVDPAAYLPLIFKSIQLGQQGSAVDARSAGREMVGATLAGGLGAALCWKILQLAPNLWLFSALTLLTVLLLAARLYGVVQSRLPASFWQNAGVTLLILLGPAVADSAGGKDVWEAFAVRLFLFVVVALYAWGAIAVLERLRGRGLRNRTVEGVPT